MPLPTDKPHRRNRRRLGRGQTPQFPPVTITALGVGATARITFNRPVVCDAPIGFTITGNTVLSQTLDSPTQLTLALDHDPENETWSFSPPASGLTPVIGGIIAPSTGVFAVNPDDVLHTAGGNYYPPPANVVEQGVQYGVSDTSETGTYNPVPPVVTILSLTNNADGTYTAVFDTPWNMTGSGTPQPNILLWSPGQNAWIPTVWVTSPAPATLTLTDTLADTDCTLLGVLAQPSGWNWQSFTPLATGTTPII